MHTLAHCCLQSVCCAPGAEEQLDALAKELDKEIGMLARKDKAVTGNGRAIAEWIDANGMALVPKELAKALNAIVVEAIRLKSMSPAVTRPPGA